MSEVVTAFLLNEEQIETLRRALDGKVLTREDPGYKHFTVLVRRGCLDRWGRNKWVISQFGRQVALAPRHPQRRNAEIETKQEGESNEPA